MRKYLLFVLIFSFYALQAEKRNIRIACVGNSITYGAGIPNREKNSYPAQLQYFLGDGYDVRNFGVSGTTVLSQGDYPYINEDKYIESKQFLPDIVIIKLGTNDTKPQNWKYHKSFMQDFQSLIDSYKALSSKPRIILLTPVRCFLSENSGISPDLIQNQVRPMIEEIAWKNNLEIVNMFNLFGDEWNGAFMPDKLHPSSIGAGEMAYKLGKYLSKNISKDGKKHFVPDSSSTFNFHGYRGYTFTLNGIECKLVQPWRAAQGKPWVLRARFWGHEPQVDIELLENGFHIAYCDVADMYGSPMAVERWNMFYNYLKKRGFCKKVVLEGMSRGGLIVYNWAVANLEKVACIYADAPVLDIKSWPMGEGIFDGSKSDVYKMMKVYGFEDKEEAIAWKYNPLDNAKIIASAHIPIIHVVGDADSIVPLKENSYLFEKLMAEYNSPIKMVHKPGIGHHPHSLNNPKVIVDFILKATGYWKNPSTYPVPGNEFRSAAGWMEGDDWHAVNEDIERTLTERKLKLLLLGNSITQGWGGMRKAVTYKPGKSAMNKFIAEKEWENAGISGDKTQNLLWRILNGNYNECKPENVVIAIGINNLLSDDDADSVAEGILAVVEAAENKFSGSRIILLGILPAGRYPTDKIRIKCNQVHEILSSKKYKKAEYINPTTWFLGERGILKDGLFSQDYIHFSEQGYILLAEKLNEILFIN